MSISSRAQPSSDSIRWNLRYRGLHGLRCVSYGLFLVAATTSISYAAPAGPPIRTGLWGTQKVPDNARALPELEPQLAANHNLSGLCLHIPLRKIGAPDGQPDFDLPD